MPCLYFMSRNFVRLLLCWGWERCRWCVKQRQAGLVGPVWRNIVSVLVDRTILVYMMMSPVMVP